MGTESRLHRDVKKMRHNTRGSGDRMKGSGRSNERNEDSKGQSSLLCLQVRALAVQGTRFDKAEGQTEGCRAWSFPLLLQVSLRDTPSDCGAQSWEQRSSGSSEPAVQQHLTPTGWVTNLRLHPCSPRPGNTLGRFLRVQRLTVYLTAQKRKNRLCLANISL